MANYDTYVASTEFGTKNNTEVAGAFSDLGFEETYVTSNDKVFVGGYDVFIGWDDCKVFRKKDTKELVLVYDESLWELSDLLVEKGMTGDDLENTEEMWFMDYLKEMLLDGGYVVFKEVGHEKLRYVDGCAYVVTKKSDKWLSLSVLVRDELNAQGIKE